MEEEIRIYEPKEKAAEVEEIQETQENSKWKSRANILKEIFKEQSEEEKKLSCRHPFFNLFYNWVIAGLLVMLTVGFISWGINVRTDRKAAALTATAMADYQAEQNAEEQARLAELAAAEATEEAVMKREAEAIAKLFYGASKFEEKYGYSENDFKTLARCVFNRAENASYPSDVADVINQKEQWVGYYENNPVLTEYYNMAYRAVEEWHHETIKPVSNDYVYAELTPNGIWLKNDFHADGYARRWRA